MADEDKVLSMEEYRSGKIFCELCKKEIKEGFDFRSYGTQNSCVYVHNNCMQEKIASVIRGLRRAGCSSENLQKIEDNFSKSDANIFFNLELLRMAIFQFRSDHAEEFGFFGEFSDLYRTVFRVFPSKDKPFCRN